MKILAICAALSVLSPSFPETSYNGKIAIAAHRGFWKCEQAVNSQNSIASLTLAQENSFWGSECDIHLTSDGEIIVNHDNAIDGLVIAEHTYSELASHLLANGEKRPTFDEYLTQAEKAPKTVLVVEFKPQGSDKRDKALVRKARTLGPVQGYLHLLQPLLLQDCGKARARIYQPVSKR